MLRAFFYLEFREQSVRVKRIVLANIVYNILSFFYLIMFLRLTQDCFAIAKTSVKVVAKQFSIL